jgi:hypothetical protein
VQSHTVKSLADVKADILAQLRPNVARKEADALLEQTPYTIDDAFFGPTPAPMAATPAPPVAAPAR